jgi:hypothetical protein
MRYYLAILLVIAVQAPLRAQAQEEKPDAGMDKKKLFDLLEKAKDEYRIFFKKPETTIEFWSAIKFEMDLGKFDLAALHLKYLLEKEPKDAVDKDLVSLEHVEGMSAFLRLKQVRTWSDHPPFHKEAVANVDVLIDRVTGAVEKHLSDPERIRKFINNLVAETEEERAFAFAQLSRSRERAVPYLVEALRVNHGKPLAGAVRQTLLSMGPETVPVYLEVFKGANEKDDRDIELRWTLLDIVHRRGDRRVLPYLWHLSSGKRYPEVIRKKAKEVLAALLRVDVNDVPAAKESLTMLAERYYQHKVPFPGDRPISVWEWDGEKISLKPFELTPAQTEKIFGLRYAREALDLDPGYEPAQVVLLSLMLERQYRQEVDQLLLKPLAPDMYNLLTTLDADLALRVMERGMEDRQLPVILPLMQTLGERGEYRAARQGAGGQPRGVVRGLYYPDRRVQFAALKAMLRMPPSTTPAVAAERIVELSSRFLAAGATPRALVVNAPADQEVNVRQTIKDLGFDPLMTRRLKDAADKGKYAADVDWVVLHRGVPANEFPFVYTQLRKDADLGAVPMLVVVEKNREKAVRQLIGKDARVLVVTEDKFKAGDELKDLLDKHAKNAEFARLSPAERKEFARVSMDALWRMARGSLKGYNVTSALPVIKDQLRSPENATLAIEILGTLPGKEIQYQLAGIVTDPRQEKLRMPAIMELNRHIQKNGLQLDNKQRTELAIAWQQAIDEPVLRKELTVTMSIIARPSARQTGAQLREFRPAPPAPPPVEKEKKEAEKKDEK